jgi:UDP-N-acetylglucosamine--N-acetylmuramyl-(pentapeptide) pyrophosphoryl-undecaprenol N-acetylglucosamine transferase
MTFFVGDNKTSIIHITGRDSYDSFIDSLDENVKASENIQVLAYSNEMPMLLNSADLVISRSGAMSVSETNYVGIAAIYIPLPTAVFDHQTKNAMFCVDNNAALLIPESELTEEVLYKNARDLLTDNRTLKRYAQNSYRIGIRDSSERISMEIEALVGVNS